MFEDRMALIEGAEMGKGYSNWDVRGLRFDGVFGRSWGPYSRQPGAFGSCQYILTEILT